VSNKEEEEEEEEEKEKEKMTASLLYHYLPSLLPSLLRLYHLVALTVFIVHAPMVGGDNVGHHTPVSM